MEDRLAELKRKIARKIARKERERIKTLETMQKRNFLATDRKELNKQKTKLRRNNKLKSMIGLKPMTEKQIQNTAFRQIKSRKRKKMRKKMRKKYTKAKNPYNRNDETGTYINIDNKPNPNTRNNLLQNLRSPFKPLENVKVVMTMPQRLPIPRDLSMKTGSRRFINSKTLKRANTI